ncbi:phage like integrase [gamma proteobacterium IMCC1989]|nr:phage like integrase [gamma proteobacterium IMCC1989]
MIKLTKTFIDRLPIPSKKANGTATQEIYRDSTLVGFGLLVGSGGTKSFFIERRVNGRVKRISIGRYGHLTPSQAKLKAQEMLGAIAMGQNPAEERKATEAKSITLSAAFEDYLNTRKSLKAGTIQNYRYSVNCHLSDWLNRRLSDINKNMVEERHREIGQKAPARANNTMRVLRAVFNHAIAKYEDAAGKSVLSFNPVDRLGRNRAWYKIDRRRTVIKAHELPVFYQATEALSNEVSRDYFRFLLFTGLRKMEAATLTWSQVDFIAKTFTIPDTKNRDPHTLPLTNHLYDLLQFRKVHSHSQWVFPSPRDNEKHLKEPRGSVAMVAEALGSPFTLHDLRRTFITIAESLDIPAYALKQLLNHKNPTDVTAGYIVSDVERIREPMEKISGFICMEIGNE